MTTRRKFLIKAAGAGLVSATGLPGLSLAATSGEERFILVILRGGLDGLSAFPPFGDSDYRSLRGGLALGNPGNRDGVFDLNGTIGMHPALSALKPFYARGELLVQHAVAIAQRTRSHFDAQDVLENGASKAHLVGDGWLNRALATLQKGDRRLGLAVGYAVPTVMRGDIPVASWAPSRLPSATPSLLGTLSDLYRHDPVLMAALTEGQEAKEMAAKAMGTSKKMKGGNLRNPRRFNTLVKAAGKLMRPADGARIAVLEMGGWDTHANQGAADGRLARNLKLLGDGLATLPDHLGPAWKKTVVAVVTEFGRTGRPNGSRGTDHGTASAAFLLGGAVDGGRVVGRWPGLAANDLYQGRDLAPTGDMRSLFKAVLKDQFGLTRSSLDNEVFPNSAGVAPAVNLIRT